MPSLLQLRRYKSPWSIAALIGLWTVGVAIGWAGLLRHSLQAASSISLDQHSISLSSQANLRPTWTIIMAVHPRCPCTSASVEMLSELLVKFHGRVECQVLVYSPAESDEQWPQTALLRRLQGMVGVTLREDSRGAQAAHFKLNTSGELILFDPAGNPRYKGGLTPSRGHVGESLGTQTVSELISTGSANFKSGPVYGCSLNSNLEGTP